MSVLTMGRYKKHFPTSRRAIYDHTKTQTTIFHKYMTFQREILSFIEKVHSYSIFGLHLSLDLRDSLVITYFGSEFLH